MSKSEFFFRLSEEGRAWAEILLSPSLLSILVPAGAAWLHGWSRPQPGWAKKKDNTK